MLRTFLASFSLAAALIGQSPNITAYPQDSVMNNNGNLVPFGVLNAGNFAEGHTQLLIPAAYLPGPGAVLNALEVHCQNVAAVVYGSLTITLSANTITSLNTTFANNLPVPQVVYTTTNLTVNYPGNAWVPFAFQTPYVHDGVSDLVIDIQKVVVPPFPFATMSTTSNPGRTDIPTMLYALGGPGSGASTSTTGSFNAGTLAVRLDWLGPPTIRLLSNPFGSANNQFSIGDTIDHTVNGNPGALYINLIGLNLGPPVPLPPVVGQYWITGSTLGLGLLSGSGDAVTTLSIPSNPSLAGLYLTFQSLTYDFASAQAVFTNATDCFINP